MVKRKNKYTLPRNQRWRRATPTTRVARKKRRSSLTGSKKKTLKIHTNETKEEKYTYPHSTHHDHRSKKLWKTLNQIEAMGAPRGATIPHVRPPRGLVQGSTDGVKTFYIRRFCTHLLKPAGLELMRPSC